MSQKRQKPASNSEVTLTKLEPITDVLLFKKNDILKCLLKLDEILTVKSLFVPSMLLKIISEFSCGLILKCCNKNCTNITTEYPLLEDECYECGKYRIKIEDEYNLFLLYKKGPESAPEYFCRKCLKDNKFIKHYRSCRCLGYAQNGILCWRNFYPKKYCFENWWCNRNECRFEDCDYINSDCFNIENISDFGYDSTTCAYCKTIGGYHTMQECIYCNIRVCVNYCRDIKLKRYKYYCHGTYCNSVTCNNCTKHIKAKEYKPYGTICKQCNKFECDKDRNHDYLFEDSYPPCNH